MIVLGHLDPIADAWAWSYRNDAQLYVGAERPAKILYPANDMPSCACGIFAMIKVPYARKSVDKRVGSHLVRRPLNCRIGVRAIRRSAVDFGTSANESLAISHTMIRCSVTVSRSIWKLPSSRSVP